MDDNKDLGEVTMQKVLAIVIAVCGFIAVLALIWAKWLALQVCLTLVFVSFVLTMLIPEDL